MMLYVVLLLDRVILFFGKKVFLWDLMPLIIEE